MRLLGFLVLFTIASSAFGQSSERRQIEYSGPVRLNRYTPRPNSSTDASARAATWRYYYSAPSYYYGGYYNSCYPAYGNRFGRRGFVFVGFSPWGGCW